MTKYFNQRTPLSHYYRHKCEKSSYVVEPMGSRRYLASEYGSFSVGMSE